MKKLIILLVTVFFIHNINFAQVNIHLGASTAVNSTFVLDQGLRADPDYVSVQNFNIAPFGFSFGADFGNKFGLQLESILTNYEQVYKIQQEVQGAAEDIGELKFDMQYLHIPLGLRFLSGKSKKARMNFNFGPQLSIMTRGSQSLGFGPEAAGSTLSIPDIPFNEDGTPDMSSLPDGTTYNPSSGDFTLPSDPSAFNQDPVTMLQKNAQSELESFRNQEFHLIAGFGLDIDLGEHIYMSVNLRGDYSFTDMRNGELIEQLQTSTLSDITGNRANLAVGLQLGLSYMVGKVPSFEARN